MTFGQLQHQKGSRDPSATVVCFADDRAQDDKRGVALWHGAELRHGQGSGKGDQTQDRLLFPVERQNGL
jgi:hypothetical protein